ncbi:MAG: phosphatase PAP2 family protein [Prevotella sp.]|nr:phosphatase PAP2 family protein [Prevotella sp.]
MKAKLFLLGMLLAAVTAVKAAEPVTMEPMKLEVPQMDLDIFKSKTNPGVKEYKFLDDVTFVGVPIFAAGWLIKSEKRGFQSSDRYANTKTKLVTNFKTSIDDYTQFFGPAMTVGLKMAGVEGRSDWPRLLTSSALSYGFMAAFVNGIKYTAKEMRPDGSTANSWPSGHTATSFVGATILHKEYGLTRSPWYSIAGYGVATATGVMRILNNRHWISDVLSGAGIGIMSTELGYFLGDVIFKKKGLLRNDLHQDSDNPSFFSISMGMGFGLKDLSFGVDELVHPEDAEDLADGRKFGVDFHSASVVGLEGAYFFNKYIGVGGNLRVRAMTAKNWSNFIDDAKDDRKNIDRAFLDAIDATSLMPTSQIQNEMSNMTTFEEYAIESDHLTEFSANVGLYFNLPLSSRFSLGSKLLIGRSMTQALDINAHYRGDAKNMTYMLNINDGFQPGNGLDTGGADVENGAELFIYDFASAGHGYDVEWDYLTLGGNNTTNFGTGLSLTYKYKSNFSWKVFVDYDYSQKEFTLTADPYRYLKHAAPNFVSLIETLGSNLDPIEFKLKKNLNHFTIGGSFAITF